MRPDLAGQLQAAGAALTAMNPNAGGVIRRADELDAGGFEGAS